MDDEEYPNFGYAWSSTANQPSTMSASWHPALRPDAEPFPTTKTSVEEDDDFFERYPGATPKKEPASQQASEVAVPEDRHVEPPLDTGIIEVHHEIQTHTESATPEQLQTLPATHAEAEGPVTRELEYGEENVEIMSPAHDRESVVFQPNESARQQEKELDEKMPDQLSNSLDSLLAENNSAGESMQEIERPGSGYEYQGEVTELENAVDEAPSKPLMTDLEAPRTVEETQREPAAHDTRATTDPWSDREDGRTQLDRSFTTNFVDSPNLDETLDEDFPEQEHHQQDEWPSAGDDKTFGELLGDEPRTSISSTVPPSKQTPSQVLTNDWGNIETDDSFGGLLGTQLSAQAENHNLERELKSGTEHTGHHDTMLEGTKSEDLTAMWQAALADDDMLDESAGLDPSAFFVDDDDGFLEDELAEIPLQTQSRGSQSQQGTAGSDLSSSVSQPLGQQPRPNQYGTAIMQSLSQGHGRSAGTPDTGLHDLYSQPAISQQRPKTLNLQNAQSFSDKSKGGYQSPYDLPMDVVKQPRQRPRQASPNSIQNTKLPATGVNSAQPGPMAGPHQSNPPVSTLSPPISRAGPVPPMPASIPKQVSAKTTTKANSGFFADLPITVKPRSRQSGPYAPQPQAAATPPPTQMPPQHPSRGPGFSPPPPSAGAPARPSPPTAAFGGLTQPEKLPLLPDQPIEDQGSQNLMSSGPPQNQRHSPSSPMAPGQPQNRFSPAPTSQAAPSTSRYSPAPTSQQAQARRYPSSSNAPSGSQQAHAFAPRTSSPLAYSTDKGQSSTYSEVPQSASYSPSSPPRTNGIISSPGLSFERPSSISQAATEQLPTHNPNLSPLSQKPRSQTPPTAVKSAKHSMQPVERSRSAASGPTAPTMRLQHRRKFSRDLEFVTPKDESAMDPLQRWKGHPIFMWSASGTVLHSFPKQIPFYAAGQGLPSVKCAPGTINLEEATTFLPMDDRNTKFPGPLAARAKGRKKEVVSWMMGKIEDLERTAQNAKMDFQMDVELRKRAEEKLILWQIVKIFVEHDGTLETNPKIAEEVRPVLLPNVAQMGMVTEVQSPSSAINPTHGSPIDRSLIIQLRQALLEGHRERAVWLAEEKKLWGHAMLIASTMGPEIWKQIVQSFVRSQVKTAGSDARSLAALYQIFAGNAEECVDELVPPSARAGFQMVSKTDGSVTSNPLEGLDQWRETLGLVASNRTPNDAQSLLALGRMLAGYGRAEAAHTCFLFARQMIKLGGADDSEANFVLLGSNHQIHDEILGQDLDSIMLTEIYEWASSLSAPSSAVQYIPHLQPFKLIHAQELAASGQTAKARSYCDHIVSAYTSTTRPSQYYHPTFAQSVNDLSALLSQSPHSGTQGLLSKSAMNKVSSGAASWFTKFVSGDDDRSSTASGPAGSEDMMGPFGRVNPDSPTLSRSGSNADLYGTMVSGAIPITSAPTMSTPSQQFQPSSAPSKYAPMGSAMKYAQSAAGHNLNAAQPQRPSSARTYAPTPAAQPLSAPQSEANRAVSTFGSPNAMGSQGSYEPRPSYASDTSSTYGYVPSAYEQPVHGQAGVVNGNSALANALSQNQVSNYEPPTGGYEPPSAGYEPPSYQPYQPDQDAEVDNTELQSKKSTMDDDNDDELEKRAAALKKAQADREADEAFKKAAEADAVREKGKGADKKGWLSGWFKKDPSIPQQGPIKAKLGEESSFYYDQDLKKWVNKKGGSEATMAAAPTPPPPKGPISRVASGAGGPPHGPPSRVSSAGGFSNSSGPPGRTPTSYPTQTGSEGPPSTGVSSGPPSRTGTPGTASDSGLPATAPTSNGEGPSSRPPTSMSNASDLDDLLGGPPAPGRRAGGTLRSKKKGGRYVDVMANS